MMFVLSNFLKKCLRSKNIVIWILVIFILYVALNIFLFKWAGDGSNRGDTELNLPINSKLEQERDFYKKNYKIIPKHLAAIQQRIVGLEKQLDSSNNNAAQLNNLIKKVYSDLKDNELDKDNKNPDKPPINNEPISPIAILVLACNRPQAIEDHLRQLISKRESYGNIAKFPIIVSQDCGHLETANSIEKFNKDLNASLKQPDLSEIKIDTAGKQIPSHLQGYFKISRHYKWALEEVLMKHAFQSVIITEDDLNISDDFFEYFDAMHKVLSRDSTLYCVSAWNDNGKKNLINMLRNDVVYRSDFFPGLGWMMLRSLWLELRVKWPAAFWDDWIRDKNQRKNRACLRPEISRTEMSIKSAKSGVSMGQFFDNYLKLIVLNTISYKWMSNDNSYLLKSNYDPVFLDSVYNKSTEYTYASYLKDSKNLKDKSILIAYKDKSEFLTYAKYFGIMDDFKDGVPRTSYMGIVKIYFESNNIYLVPSAKNNWKGYDSTW